MDQANDIQGMTARTATEHQPESRADKSALDNIKNTVADKLQSAAGALEQRASRQQGAMSQYAGKASTWLGDAADYVREVNPQQVKKDIQNEVRRNPGRALLIAGAAGLLLGVLLRR